MQNNLLPLPEGACPRETF